MPENRKERKEERMMKKYNLVVIGFGKAGKTLSGAMAKHGH